MIMQTNKRRFLKSFSILLFLASNFSSSTLYALTPSDFVKKAFYRDVKISPNGKHIAVSMVTQKESTIIFFDRASFKPVGRLGFSNNTEPGEFYWVNNERIVLKLLEIEPWLEEPAYYGQLLGVNIDGSKAETLFGYQNAEVSIASGGIAKKKKVATVGWATIVDLLPEDRKNIIIQSTPYKKDYSSHPSLLKLNVYSGKITSRLGTSPVERGEFQSDGHGNIRLVYGFDEKNQLQVYQRKDNQSVWKWVDNSYYSRSFIPVGLTPSSSEMYVGDSDEFGRWTLFKMDIISGKYSKPLFRSKLDVSSIEVDRNSRKVIGLNFDDGYPAFKSFNSDLPESQLFMKLMKSFPNRKISITSQSKDDNFYIVLATSDIEPAVFYLYQKKSNQLKRLFSSMPHIKSAQLAAMFPISFAARDGEKIHGYLTLPKNNREKHPAVVLVHGGPHQVRDSWGYDSQVQLLANEGYAVLQINYRGSRGYGDDFEKAGFKHWGDLIQQDIVDASRWLAQQSDINGSKMCIMGGSFGAYSAVMSASLAPKLFKCVVANAGIYDLPLMFEKGDVQTTFDGLYYLNDVLGSDIGLLEKFSPVNRVEQLQASLLIAHGVKDKRAPFVHAKRLRNAMKQAGKKFQWFVKDKEGHGFYSYESQLAYYLKVTEFLNQHIGVK